MSIELALAIPATVDLCLKYGKELQKLCSALKNADVQVSERVLRLDNGWVKFTHQLNFLQRIQHVMEDEHRDVCEQTLRVLLGKLEIVTEMLRGLLKLEMPHDAILDPGFDVRIRKTKFAFKKESLDRAIEELEVWQRTADQSWFLLMRIADSQVDDALKENTPTAYEPSTAVAIPSAASIRSGLSGGALKPGLTLSADVLSQMTTHLITCCPAQIAERVYSTGQTAAYVLNHIPLKPFAKRAVIKQNARDLAQKLQHDDPHTFGLLTCKGIATPSSIPPVADGEAEPQLTLTMIFRMPPGTSNPRCLRDLLLNTPAPHSLSLRYDIARQLARSISSVHTFGFVHKNLRPETVLTFAGADGLAQSVFLVGFEHFRREDQWTQRRGDDFIERNLYRHPSRQGVYPRDDYVMQHDIYSLGVCLLEIGLWRSFISYEEGRQPLDAELFGIEPHESKDRARAFVIMSAKEHLLLLARCRLPQYMGSRYAEIVETCLTCLDPDNADFGDAREFEDEDGIRVGVRYIEKVLLRLNRLYV
ncbi:hypothetical protein CONLIGDRAFT_664331 [Coniochaeta ligniaria NRRL 30616]|uniref:Protein kinase domain-containing protein n=1 Tax=Coniochaeta ligniaria NRRL 30616 TaxID=1408157 RepID=A0A1J7J8T3_9PEZI|nr:hypothetical protein CONLIGDRAFT_664331 [Coniochaeta ligniaria NRRL 30616]